MSPEEVKVIREMLFTLAFISYCIMTPQLKIIGPMLLELSLDSKEILTPTPVLLEQ